MIIMIDLQVIGLIELKIWRYHRVTRLNAVEKIGPNPELIIRKYIEESVNHFLGETVRIEVNINQNRRQMQFSMILLGKMYRSKNWKMEIAEPFFIK